MAPQCVSDGCKSSPHIVQANGLCVACNKLETGHVLRQTSTRLNREGLFEEAPSFFLADSSQLPAYPSSSARPRSCPNTSAAGHLSGILSGPAEIHHYTTNDCAYGTQCD